jgi:hypothetical protein
MQVSSFVRIQRICGDVNGIGDADDRRIHRDFSDNATNTMNLNGPKKPSVRTWIPRVCNAMLWLVFCALSGTGLLLAFRLPPGSRGGRGLSAMGWDRHEWGDLHTWISYAFLALILLHMALHWRWFWQVAARRRSWPLLAGIGLGILLALLIFFQPVSQGEDHEEGRGPQGNRRGPGFGR